MQAIAELPVRKRKFYELRGFYHDPRFYGSLWFSYQKFNEFIVEWIGRFFPTFDGYHHRAKSDEKVINFGFNEVNNLVTIVIGRFIPHCQKKCKTPIDISSEEMLKFCCDEKTQAMDELYYQFLHYNPSSIEVATGIKPASFCYMNEVIHKKTLLVVEIFNIPVNHLVGSGSDNGGYQKNHLITDGKDNNNYITLVDNKVIEYDSLVVYDLMDELLVRGLINSEGISSQIKEIYGEFYNYR